MSSLGFESFLQGIQQGDPALLQRSATETQQAIDLDPTNPRVRMNLAVTLIALDRSGEADEAYRAALENLIFVDVAKGTLRDEPFVEEAVLAGALSDLQTVESRRPELAQRIAGIKQYLVGSVARQAIGNAIDTGATVSQVKAIVLPAELEWQAELQGWDTKRDDLSVQWYYNDPQQLGWTVIPRVSGVADVTVNDYNLQSYLASTRPAGCLPDGDYRVELYVNGRLASRAQATSNFGDLKAFAARDLTVAICRPPDWTEAELSYAGLFNGVESPDKKSGVAIFRLGVPGRGKDEAQVSVYVMDFITKAFAGLFTSPPVARGEPEQGYLLGMSGARWRTYDYADGQLREGAGVDPTDGSVTLVWVFGPQSMFDSKIADVIIASLSRYR
jgi:hypothetical protein